MTDEEKTTPRIQSNSTKFIDPSQLREQAEQKAQSIQQPDFSSMTPEEIEQRFHELRVKLIEAGLQNELLRSRLEACRDLEKKDGHLETLVNSLMENIPDIVFIKDTQGVYLACNLEFARHAGRRVEDIIGKTDYDLYSSEDADFFRKNDQLMLEQGSSRQNEEWISYPDGRKILLDTMKTPYRNSDGSIIGVMAICRDITRRYCAEKALQKSEERFQKMLSLIPDMISIHDPEMNIVYSNWKGIAGVPEEHRVLGTKCYRTYRHFEEVCPECRAVSVLDTRNAFEEEVKLTGGSWVDIRVIPLIDENGVVEAVMEWARDITDRKEVEQRLLDSEQKHRRLFENMLQGVLYQDTDGKIISANPAAESILGLSLEQMREKTSMASCWKMIKEDGTEVPDTDHPAMAALRTGETVGPVVRGVFHQEKNTYVWLSITAFPVFEAEEADPLQAYIIFADITDRREANEALRKSKDDYQAITNLTGDIIVQVDTEGRWVFLNDQACEFWGEPRKKLLHQSFSDYLHPMDRKKTHAKIQEMIVSGNNVKNLVNRQKNHQGWRVVQWNGAPFYHDGEYAGFQATGRDITLQREKEKQIQENERRLNTLISHTPAVIYSFFIEDGKPRTTYISKNVKHVLGYDAEDFIGNYGFFTDRVHPDDLQITNGVIPELLATGSCFIEEFRFMDKQGTYRWLQDGQQLITHEDGTLEAVGTWWDITERKQAEAALLEYQKRLSQAQRFARAGMWEFDMKTSALYWSPECEALFGLEKGGFEGTFEAFLDRVHPDDLEYVIRVNQPITELQKGVPLEYDHRIISRSGDVRWVRESAGVALDENGDPARITGFIMDITEGKRSEHELQMSFRFQEIISDLSSNFIKTTRESFDRDINKMLLLIGNHFQVDRSYLFLFSDDQETMTNTHEWCRNGVASQIDNIREQPIASLPWWKARIFSEDLIHIPDVAALPGEAAAEKKEFARQHIASLISIPIKSTEETLGFIGFDAVGGYYRWSDFEIVNLKTIANIISDLLLKLRNETLLLEAKKKAEESEALLRRSREQLSVILSNTPAVIYTKRVDRQGNLQITYINDNVNRVLGFEPKDFTENVDFWADCVHPEDLPKLQEKLSGREMTSEYRFKDRKGYYRWLLDAQQVLNKDDTVTEIIGTWWCRLSHRIT
ncbi:PAS domain S-box protein [Desulfobulbus alkaliphilus]|uniref:PAS domain S-box protein n=1 Tax=Desulfobulbus alkaliphilus TaxID=869814 RepID=UPI0019644690|nr:PAS domain S-box protein [Desulfobulbus alkaliphilus]MBM9538427.1 PAS domain S-box protein [Desulfobulbus alkaliphilus]